MRGTIHQALDRVRLLPLAVALLFCCVPTAHAIRCPTLDFEPLRLNEEMPKPEQNGWYVALGVYDQEPIGLFVGNNPINYVDPYGLWGWDGDYIQYGLGFGGEGTAAGFWGGFGEGGLEGAAAAGDGLLDAATLGGGFGLFDPGIFGRSGAYDPCDPTLRTSRRLGEFAGSLLDTAGALRGAAKLGGTRLGHALNHNPKLRFGPGRMPKNGPFPASPSAPRISIGPQRPGVRNPHIDLRIRPFDF